MDLLSPSQWWSEFKSEISRPLDTFSALFSGPSERVAGEPIVLPQGMLDFGGSYVEDSISSAQVRAFGVDPVTGKLFVKNSDHAVSNGYDAANPMAFVLKTEADAAAFYNRQLALNSDSGDGDSSGNDSSGTLLIVIAVVIVAILVFKAVA